MDGNVENIWMVMLKIDGNIRSNVDASTARA